ncbi:phage integrase family domain protein [Mycobacterium kansasii 824]|nr:phage integrase family domain protein [Mycobacterium kansasii 824]
MGHASPETTARYVHLSLEQLAAEYGAARPPGRSTAMTVATVQDSLTPALC